MSADRARIATTCARDGHDQILVQEKLDGSCVCAARIGDDIVALGRQGDRVAQSPNPGRRL